MFVNVEKLHEQIAARDDRAFVSLYIFESIPQIFNGDLDNWVHWKSSLGEKIEVDPRDIVLTGSAAVGYSLNPSKKFKRFDYNSDIDLGIVSNHHFDLAWRYLRHRRVEWLTISRAIKDAIKDHKSNYVFSGTIAADRILPLLPFGIQWQKALDDMSKSAPTAGREIKLRIYKDFECLRYYQCNSVRSARELALATKKDPISIQEIPTED